jgi:F0F1-type ATP synthase assembly protein I
MINRKTAILVAMALELPGSIIGGVIIGHLLDQYFNTAPWFMLGLTILGFTGASIRLLRWVKYYSEERTKSDAQGREDQ